MNTKITFAVLGLAAVLVLALATTVSSNAYAVNDKWTQSCTGPEDPQGPPGECAGGSEKSGPHDEQREIATAPARDERRCARGRVCNPSGAPPGLFPPPGAAKIFSAVPIGAAQPILRAA